VPSPFFLVCQACLELQSYTVGCLGCTSFMALIMSGSTGRTATILICRWLP
jgi:hypothetical protein